MQVIQPSGCMSSEVPNALATAVHIVCRSCLHCVKRDAHLQGRRALDFVLKNQGLIDKTLLFDIELIRVNQ